MARFALMVLMALLLAAGPTLGALATAQAANAHAGMAMSDSSADDGCCDHSTPVDTNVCAGHCAAGIIAPPVVFVPSEPLSISVASVLVLPSASHAPTPDIAPPKSSAA